MYDENKRLYVHGYDASRTAFWADPVTGLSASFWLRAMGWLAAALADLCEILPEGDERSEIGALLQEMMRYAHAVLPEHPVNIERVRQGKNPANAIWFWGEGRRPALAPFAQLYGLRGAVISAVDLIQGIGKCAEMRVIQVPGATGNYHTDFAAKGRAAIEALSTDCDFVYIHVEAPDECGHQHQINEKVYSIEQIDGKIVGPVMEYLAGCGEPYAVLVLPDHPTPLAIRTHTGDPVPFILYNSAEAKAEQTSLHYCEEAAAKTGVFVEKGHSLMNLLIGREKLLQNEGK